MGFSFSSFNPVKLVKKVIKTTVKIVKKVISWIVPKPPDIPDFGTSEFDDFETGILINKQSKDASIPVIYGTRMIGGTECSWNLVVLTIRVYTWQSFYVKEKLTILLQL